MRIPYLFAVAGLGIILASGTVGATEGNQPPMHDKTFTLEQMQAKRAEMFKRLDANGDGNISQAEFTAAGDEQFKRMDTNGDGKVTREERKQSWHDRKGGKPVTPPAQ